MKNKKTVKDLSVLIAAPIIVAIVAVTFKLNYFTTTLLFFGLPGLYLSLQDKTKIKRNLVFSLAFTLPAIYADYIAERSLAWAEPSSVLSYRVGGIVPIEAILWFFLLSYLIVAFYEHFFDHIHHKNIGKRMKLLFALVTVGTAGFIFTLLVRAQHPIISYFYLKFGLVLGLIPLSIFLIKFPRFITVFLKTAPYFLVLSILNEFVGLHNGHWFFPSQQFIGWVGVGTYRVPYEELLFWMILFSSIVIAYFEVFDDNRLKFKGFSR